MLAKLKTFSLLGIDALPVEVEVDVSPSGLPKTVLVGLPEAAVKESTHRVERAIVNSGFPTPAKPRGHQPRPGMFPPVKDSIARVSRLSARSCASCSARGSGSANLPAEHAPSSWVKFIPSTLPSPSTSHCLQSHAGRGIRASHGS